MAIIFSQLVQEMSTFVIFIFTSSRVISYISFNLIYVCGVYARGRAFFIVQWHTKCAMITWTCAMIKWICAMIKCCLCSDKKPEKYHTYYNHLVCDNELTKMIVDCLFCSYLIYHFQSVVHFSVYFGTFVFSFVRNKTDYIKIIY